ncbi:MAG: hypothetical protein ACREO5_11515, partial [Candidatus Binatia bacterium]
MNHEDIKANRFAMRKRLAFLYIFLALLPFLVGTSHTRAQVKAGAEILAFNTEAVASAGVAGVAQAAASLPLRGNIADVPTGMALDPSSWILVGLGMM